MHFELKQYQDGAVGKLRDAAKELLGDARHGDGQTLVFKAATGSGKTIMMAEFLHRLVDEHEFRDNLSFIWAAPRKLHLQSMDKLQDFYGYGGRLICREFHNLTDNEIKVNEILFFNWESVVRKNKETLLLTRENERGHYLGKVIEKTRNAARRIVLIIDESHHAATSELAENLRKDLHPSLTVEASATPQLRDPDAVVKVSRRKVIDEGMIKKGIVLNEGFKNILTGDKLKTALAKGTTALVLRTALEKRQQIAAALRAESSRVNPLMLIQLPDARGGDEKVKDEVEKLLSDEHGVSVTNGTLAVYLSEDKENLTNITRGDSGVQVMLFKQAIALGWDCPRACVLVLLREMRNIEFSVQTVGRIMRMPNPEVGHYQNELLNTAYVYTNLGDIKIVDDIATNYLRINTSTRLADYEDIKLPSTYRKRQRELTRLGRKFREIFLLNQGQALKEAVDIDARMPITDIVVDTKIADVDAYNNANDINHEHIKQHTRDELEKQFDDFASKNISPLYPDIDSVGGVRDTVYKFFSQHYQMSFETQETEILRIALDAKNKKHFAVAIARAVTEYLSEVQNQDDELLPNHNWQVPKQINYEDSYEKFNAKKSVMEPVYVAPKKTSQPEKEFMKELGADNSVKWWYKNGDQGGNYFAVPYTENGEEKLFYVDFIVQFADGRIGLFDTKSGLILDAAGDKSDGLLKYIKTQNEKRPADRQLSGGIVTCDNGVWKIYDGASIAMHSKDLSNWKVLEL